MTTMPTITAEATACRPIEEADTSAAFLDAHHEMMAPAAIETSLARREAAILAVEMALAAERSASPPAPPMDAQGGVSPWQSILRAEVLARCGKTR